MNILSDLRRTRDETLDYFALPEADLGKRYGPDKWSIRQILHHLADAESVLYGRLRRAISEERPVVWGFDQDAWVVRLEYDTLPLEPNRELYRALRNAVIVLAERHYEKDGARTLNHSADGIKTVKDVFDKVVWHNERHLGQIAQALK